MGLGDDGNKTRAILRLELNEKYVSQKKITSPPSLRHLRVPADLDLTVCTQPFKRFKSLFFHSSFMQIELVFFSSTSRRFFYAADREGLELTFRTVLEKPGGHHIKLWPPVVYKYLNSGLRSPPRANTKELMLFKRIQRYTTPFLDALLTGCG